VIYEIEFYRWKNNSPEEIKVIRRYSGEFASRDAAWTYGLANAGAEADGFFVLQSGTIRSEFILNYRPRNA
jgi:hypothetical protein